MSDAVWLDAPWSGPGFREPPIPFDPSDRGLLLGEGVFDTALVLGGRMVWRDRHVARLLASCLQLGFAMEPGRVERAVTAAAARLGDGSLRLTATGGPGPRGLAPPPDRRPTLLAAGAPLRAGALFAPITLRTAAARRNETSVLSRIKSLGYADAALAAAEAMQAGADDALFLNTAGNVACAGAANLFAVLDGCLVTPPLADGAVDGVARGAVLRLAGGRAVERSLTPAALRRAAAVFATSSLRLVAPVVAIDGEPLKRDDAVSRLAGAMAESILADCGTDPRTLPR